MTSNPNKPHPPFLHPRRDPYFAWPRRTAAFFLSLVQAAWFVAILTAVKAGTPLDFSMILLGLAGVFVIAAKSSLAIDLALGWMDWRHGLSSAPAGGEILRRFLMGLMVPFALLSLGFLGRGDTGAVVASLGALVAAEMIFRILGMGRWRGGIIPRAIIRPLLTDRLSDAMGEFRKHPFTTDTNLETTALAISGLSIRNRDTRTLGTLEEELERRIADPQGINPATLERTLAVVRADHQRLATPEEAGPAEAEALRQIPAGHPRRLALGLFVATAALDQEDPESAEKALAMLHSRDVVFSTARVLVDWLLLQAALQRQHKELEQDCLAALRTFNVPRELKLLNMEALGAQDDAYARWLKRAKDGLQERFVRPQAP